MQIGIKTAAVVMAGIFLASLAPAFAAEDHPAHHPASAKPGAVRVPVTPAKEPGKVLGEHKVKTYSLRYVLLNRVERDAAMKGMEGMEMAGMSKSPDVTGHLIVFIKDASGKPVSAEVGFEITGPDKAVARTLTMGMNNGYGADVVMKARGSYAVRVKIKIPGKSPVVLEDSLVIAK